ncbi:probable inactive purple acid phosphatase 1 [Triticum dicoccoides]|uniref:probable inactive purple acid phosphatase 1 n=1 Tax=Triticum dicoccoides TaxID=85692 RepID=UPI00188FA8D7|nr:probable inactive purple acid phosphatase 1 [Triticum dicoccoides]
MPSGEELIEDPRFSTDSRRSEVLEEKLLLGMPWKSASDSICPSENQWVEAPLLCTTPIKFQYANYTTADYAKTGKGSLRLQIINQTRDIIRTIFWRPLKLTWTSGYSTKEAAPFVEWGIQGQIQILSPARHPHVQSRHYVWC